jgi:uncharacterized damage-inducible protein DinB
MSLFPGPPTPQLARITVDGLFTDVNGYPQSQGATILQTTYHNTWHRAKIRHMLNKLGVENVWDGDPQE